MAIDVDVVPPEAAMQPHRRALQELAVAQHGCVTRCQLLRLGFTRHEVQGMLDARWLHRVHRGVYAVGRRALGSSGRRMAAVLAAGPGALLSHRTAADHLSLRRSAQALIEVVVPHDRGRRIAGVKVRIARHLEARDRIVHDGIPCTSVP